MMRQQLIDISSLKAGGFTLSISPGGVRLAAVSFYIPETLKDDFRKDQEYADYQVCYSIWIALESNPELTSNQEDELYIIARKHSTRASGLAKTLLLEYGRESFEEVLVSPANTEKSSRKVRKKPMPKGYDEIKLYPNPASDFLVLEGPPSVAFDRVIIYDIKGQIVLDERLGQQLAQQLIMLPSLLPGTYEVHISTKGVSEPFTTKIEVQ